MPTAKKTRIVQDLTEKLKRAKALVLTDYSGLSVPRQQKLRKRIKEVGGDFTITKNTLLKIAFERAEYPSFQEQLAGPTAALFAYEDEIAPIKALAEFRDEFKLPQIKIGLFEGKVIEKEAILKLARIPSQPELKAKLVYLISSPIGGLVNALYGNLRGLVWSLSQIQKEGGED